MRVAGVTQDEGCCTVGLFPRTITHCFQCAVFQAEREHSGVCGKGQVLNWPAEVKGLGGNEGLKF